MKTATTIKNLKEVLVQLYLTTTSSVYDKEKHAESIFNDVLNALKEEHAKLLQRRNNDLGERARLQQESNALEEEIRQKKEEKGTSYTKLLLAMLNVIKDSDDIADADDVTIVQNRILKAYEIDEKLNEHFNDTAFEYPTYSFLRAQAMYAAADAGTKDSKALRDAFMEAFTEIVATKVNRFQLPRQKVFKVADVAIRPPPVVDLAIRPLPPSVVDLAKNLPSSISSAVDVPIPPPLRTSLALQSVTLRKTPLREMAPPRQEAKTVLGKIEMNLMQSFNDRYQKDQKKERDEEEDWSSD
jgi:hypothetical protein